MSTNEPVTTSKVILETTKGEIEIELWAKETPIASKNFLQNCLDETFVGCMFDKIVKNFIVQVGGPGLGSAKFPNEVNPRLKFNRRGLIGTCNIEGVKDSNNGQFFITLDSSCADLQGSSTLFGKVMGNSIYNVVQISESELGQDGEVLFPTKITGCKILENYFKDMARKPMSTGTQKVDTRDTTKSKMKSKGKKGKKAKSTISFGDDLEEGETIGMEMKAVHEFIAPKAAVAVVQDTVQDTVEQEIVEEANTEEPTEQRVEQLVEHPVEQPTEPPAKRIKTSGSNQLTAMREKYVKGYKIDKTTRERDTMDMLNQFMNSKHDWL